MADATKPFSGPELGDLPTPRAPSRNVVVNLDRLRATVEALEKAEERIDCYGLGDEACGGCLRCLNERWKSELHRRVVAEQRAEKAEAERDEARACIADTLSVLLDPATSGEHWSILPSVVENLRDERDTLKATVNDALEQLRHEEHLRTTAERAVAEAAERLDEFGDCPTVADGIQAMRLRLIEARAERDEARAEVARLQDLHTRCAAFDDQPGPSCVVFAAQVARLRELVALLLPKADAFWRSGETRPPWVAEARAALKETP